MQLARIDFDMESTLNLEKYIPSCEETSVTSIIDDLLTSRNSFESATADDDIADDDLTQTPSLRDTTHASDSIRRFIETQTDGSFCKGHALPEKYCTNLSQRPFPKK